MLWIIQTRTSFEGPSWQWNLRASLRSGLQGLWVAWVGRCRRRFGQDLHFPGTSLRSSSSPLNALEDRECFHRGYVRRRDGEKIWGATSVTKVRDSVFAEDTEDDDLYSVVFSEFLVDCIQRNFLPILEVMWMTSPRRSPKIRSWIFTR